MTFTRGIVFMVCIVCWLVVVLVVLGGTACSSRAREAPVAGLQQQPECSDEPKAQEHMKQGSSSKEHAHGSGAHADHAHGTYADTERWSARLDDSARDAWQLPDEVLRALALTPSMTVADVGAGTGYFAVRLARAVPQGQVIATDIEPEMVRHLEERARREQLPNLRSVRASHNKSGLTPNTVDAVLIVHVWHHLGDRACYARDLASALRPGGRLLIVDFSPAAHRGPPMHMRLAPETIIAELASAGLTAKVSPIGLPDQFIVEARKPLP
jgi:arsenite methyltransferase